MQFLNPIWLFAATSIAVPILIHLWNVKSGKVLKVGSIALMGESSRKNSRSLKLQDLWLLLLRCVMIIILSLLLAEPIFKSSGPREKKGWILIPPGEIDEAYKEYKAELDSLISEGYEFHLFSAGFLKSDLKDEIQTASIDTGNTSPFQAGISYRSVFKDFQNMESSPATARIYTSRLLKRFAGDLPVLPSNITWKTYASDPSPRRWIQTAWYSSSDSILVILGHSDTSATFFTKVQIQAGQVQEGVEIRIQDGKPAASFVKTDSSTDSSAIPVKTSKIRIGIFSDRYHTDASYLRSALEAIRSFSKLNLDIQTVSGSDLDLDLIFWLSDKALPPFKSGSKATIFRYEPGKAGDVKLTLAASGRSYRTAKQLALYKIVADKTPEEGLPIWEDNAGNAVLKKEINEGARILNFYSRFNPAWNDLVWSEAFPEMLLDLIVENADDLQTGDIRSYKNDRRTIPQNLISSPKGTKFSVQTDSDTSVIPADTKPLTYFFAIVLSLLICVERWLAHAKTRKSDE